MHTAVSVVVTAAFMAWVVALGVVPLGTPPAVKSGATGSSLSAAHRKVHRFLYRSYVVQQGAVTLLPASCDYAHWTT